MGAAVIAATRAAAWVRATGAAMAGAWVHQTTAAWAHATGAAMAGAWVHQTTVAWVHATGAALGLTGPEPGT